MLERDVILSKVNIVENCLKAIHKAVGTDVEKLHDDMVENVATLNLQRAIQATIDMAQVVIAAQNLSLPNSYGHAFRIIAKAGVIDDALATQMVKMVGFRNIAVHAYQEIDVGILKAIITNHLDELRIFCGKILQTFPAN